MQIQKLSNQNIKNKQLPAKAVIIQLLDKNQNHLAFIACQHERLFALYDSGNDRETSHFLEEISDFETEILRGCFRHDKELEKSFGGWTGELIITDADSKIFYHERPA